MGNDMAAARRRLVKCQQTLANFSERKRTYFYENSVFIRLVLRLQKTTKVILAERQGFEPWEGCPSTVFKTAAIDRSAISPLAILA